MKRGKTQIRQINKDREAFLVKWMKFIFVLVAKNQWCKSGTNPWALVRKRYTEVVAVMYNVR